MSIVIDEIEQPSAPERSVKPQYQTEDGQPNVALLQDRTPEAFQATSAVTLILGCLGSLFVLLNYFPLWHTDLWGHLSYGKWIWTHGSLPATEPFMPLSSGVPMVDTAWISQLLGYFMIKNFGTAGLQFLYGSAIVCVAGCIAFSIDRRTRQPWIALLSVCLFYWCDYQQLLMIRPQLAGLVCFIVVFSLASSFHVNKWTLIVIPVLFTVWANVHGSFVVGLAILGALTIGRAIDVFRRTGSLKMVFAETRTRHLLLTTELAAAAVILNPYGIAIYPEVFSISNHPNLSSLIEWEPLTLRMKQGQAAAVLGLALSVMYRLSPRRVTTGEILILIGLGAGALWTSRLIVWWAPVAAYYFGLHAASVWRTWMHATPRVPKRGGLYSVSSLGLLWIFFAFTPFGDRLLHGAPADAEKAKQSFVKSVAKSTPLEAAAYLNEHPPHGQVFNSYTWGDYLIWAGPQDLQVFVASHVHLIPEEVWGHYLEISQAGPTWNLKLDRYGVNTVVIDPQQHAGLAARLSEASEIWEKSLETKQTVIFTRKKLI